MNDVKMEVLITANSEYELGVIKNILEANSIPYLVRDRESGGYMRIFGGSSPFGTDILVDANNREMAKELIFNFIKE